MSGSIGSRLARRLVDDPAVETVVGIDRHSVRVKGLEIHEAPSISKRPSTLRAGHVVTVEPGLYYLGLGGVRIEDVALVERNGSRNLTRVPKVLEI